MNLKPSTRQFLLAAGFVILVFGVVVIRFIWQLTRATGLDPEGSRMAFLMDGGFFGVIVVLGIAFAWFRLVRERRERSRRKPPLSL